MPKIRIEVSEVWWERMNTGIGRSIDTLGGLAAQIEAHKLHGTYDAEEMLGRIESQLIDLRRHLEAFQMPF